MVTWCYILASALGAVVALYGLLEIHYFLRMCLCVVLARYIKRKTHILDTTTVTGICLTTDIDTLLYHMNNARYLRELDFARVDFYERTKLYRTILSKGGAVVQGAATIRYRRFIRPFAIFRITSKIIYWDNQSVFMEHRFISPKDGFVHCIAICRQRIIDCSTEEIMEALLNMQSSHGTTTTTTTTVTTKAANGSTTTVSNSTATQNPSSGVEVVENGDVNIKLKPEMPLDISKWMEYNDISSKNLRNGC